MLRFALAIVVPFVAISAEAAAAEARPGWYPRAGDLCAEYVARTSKPDLYGALLAPQLARDPVIAKYIADYNAASGSSDKGARAMSNLLKYCDAHASKKLGDVTAQEVMTDTTIAVTRTVQPAAADTSGLDAWYRQLVFYCGADNECKRLSKKAYDDAVACARGDAAACNEGGKNLLQLDPWLDAWLDKWYREVLADCAADNECKSIAKNAYDHGLGCNRGDAKACGDKSGDEMALARWKEKRGK